MAEFNDHCQIKTNSAICLKHYDNVNGSLIFCPLCQETLDSPLVDNLEDHLVDTHKVDKRIAKQWIEASKKIALEADQNSFYLNNNGSQPSTASSIIFSPQSSSETNTSSSAAKSPNCSDYSHDDNEEKAVNLPMINIAQPNYQRNTSGQRSPRTKFTEYQVQSLRKYFGFCQRPTAIQIEQLSFELGLEGRVIGVWFQNSRQKYRATQMVAKRCQRGQNSHAINLRYHFSSNSASNDAGDAATQDTGNNQKPIECELEEVDGAKLKIIEQFSDVDDDDQQSPTISKSTLDEKESDGLETKRACMQFDENRGAHDSYNDGSIKSEAIPVIRIMPREPRHIRTRVSLEQQFMLDKVFYAQKYPKKELIWDLSLKTKLPAQVVRNWFANRRAKERKEQQDFEHENSDALKLEIDEGANEN